MLNSCPKKRITNEQENLRQQNTSQRKKLSLRMNALTNYRQIANLLEVDKISSPEILQLFAEEPKNPGY